MKKDGKSTMPNSPKIVDRVTLKTLNGDLDGIDHVLTHWALEIIESHRRVEEDLARTLERLSSANSSPDGTERLLKEIPDRLWIGGDLYALSIVKIDSAYHMQYVKRSNPNAILFSLSDASVKVALSNLISKLQECENEGFLQHKGGNCVFDEKAYAKSHKDNDYNYKKTVKNYNNL